MSILDTQALYFLIVLQHSLLIDKNLRRPTLKAKEN